MRHTVWTGQGRGPSQMWVVGSSCPAAPGWPTHQYSSGRRWFCTSWGGCSSASVRSSHPCAGSGRSSTAAALGGRAGSVPRAPRSPTHPTSHLFTSNVSSQFLSNSPTLSWSPPTLPCWSLPAPLPQHWPPFLPLALPHQCQDAHVFLNRTPHPGPLTLWYPHPGALLCSCLLGELLFNLSAPTPLSLPGMAPSLGLPTLDGS